jgi:hypothetical protein
MGEARIFLGFGTLSIPLNSLGNLLSISLGKSPFRRLPFTSRLAIV